MTDQLNEHRQMMLTKNFAVIKEEVSQILTKHGLTLRDMTQPEIHMLAGKPSAQITMNMDIMQTSDS